MESIIKIKMDKHSEKNKIIHESMDFVKGNGSHQTQGRSYRKILGGPTSKPHLELY